jgi:hypothetical protein
MGSNAHFPAGVSDGIRTRDRLDHNSVEGRCRVAAEVSSSG